MIARTFVFVTLSLFAAAAPGAPGPVCSNGPVQCCNQIQPADQVNWASILPTNVIGNLPVGIQGLQTPVGLNCIPVGIQGGAGNSCATQTTCCENNNFQGIVAIGCSPVNVGL